MLVRHIMINLALPAADVIHMDDFGQFLSMVKLIHDIRRSFQPVRLETDRLFAVENGRIEDFRAFASIVKGRRKADNVTAWLVPGSWVVRRQIMEEGIDKILEEAGFELRLPSCSACLAMNPDKVPAGKLSISTSNRNFVGRQGPGSRTILASPLTVAASAVTGVVTDPRTLMD